MIKLTMRHLMTAAAVAGTAAFMAPTAASAQATRTFISGVGDDANPCSRTAPCRTWAGAISKTAQGGEIDCLDPGGFGAVTITKSMTLICDYSDGGVLVAGQNGIIINDSGAGTVHVVLSGLNIEGLGFSQTSPGVRGVWFISGASLTVRNSTIRGFRDPANGSGIAFTPSTAARLLVDNVSLNGNGAPGSVGAGIIVQPTGANGSANVTITNSRVFDSHNNGILFNSNGNTSAAGISASVTNTTSTGNGGAGIAVVGPASGSNIKVVVNGSDVSGNSIGIVTNGPKATVRVGNTTIANNSSFGVLAAGAVAPSGLFSYSPATNQLNGNGTDGTFTGTVAAQ
jgi:hypothetical protein